MKSIFFAIFIIAIQAINTLALAQNEASNIDSKLNLELIEIKRERLLIESKFKTNEAECYKNFAVSNCLQELKSGKLLALSEIKRRELELNDQKRLLKADVVEKKAYEKSKQLTEKKQIQSQIATPKAEKPEKSSSAETASIAPTPKDPEKLSAQRSLAAQQRVLDSSKKKAASQRKALSRANKLNQAQAHEAEFNKKLLDAQERKSAAEKTAAEKTKPKSASLPIPTTVGQKP